MIDLSPMQQRAVEGVEAWFDDPHGPQVYRLFGYAGSGKTTLAREIAERVWPSEVRYAAFSGKAASVLQSKGCVGASTIHSLIYKPVGKSRAELDALQIEHARTPTPELAARIAKLEEELRRPSFILNEESSLRETSLLILDEVSMVGERIALDLLSFGVKILCLGDPMQLPPIQGEGFFTDHKPNTMLTELHRSALDSPVTRLATVARQSDDDDYGVSGMDGSSGRSAVPVPMTEFDQVLVWKNATRWNIIRKMRKQLGHTGSPKPGERIITLANNPKADVLNGQQFTVLSCDDRASQLSGVYLLQVRTDTGIEREMKVFTSGFDDQEGENTAKRLGWNGEVAAATYAHALTVHKAQGSQWNSVLVLDESRGVARVSGAQIAQRWFYTALTRAAERVVIRPAPAR